MGYVGTGTCRSCFEVTCDPGSYQALEMCTSHVNNQLGGITDGCVPCATVCASTLDFINPTIICNGTTPTQCVPCESIGRVSFDGVVCGQCLAGTYSSDQTSVLSDCSSCINVTCPEGMWWNPSQCGGTSSGCTPCTRGCQEFEYDDGCRGSEDTICKSCSDLLRVRGDGLYGGVLCGDCSGFAYGEAGPSVSHCQNCEETDCTAIFGSNFYRVVRDWNIEECGVEPNCESCHVCEPYEYQLSECASISNTECGKCSDLFRTSLIGQACGNCSIGYFGSYGPSIQTCTACNSLLSSLSDDEYLDPRFCGPGPTNGIRSCTDTLFRMPGNGEFGSPLCSQCLTGYYGADWKLSSISDNIYEHACLDCREVICPEGEAQNFTECGRNEVPHDNGCGNCASCPYDQYNINGNGCSSDPTKGRIPDCRLCSELNRLPFEGNLCGTCKPGYFGLDGEKAGVTGCIPCTSVTCDEGQFQDVASCGPGSQDGCRNCRSCNASAGEISFGCFGTYDYDCQNCNSINRSAGSDGLCGECVNVTFSGDPGPSDTPCYDCTALGRPRIDSTACGPCPSGKFALSDPLTEARFFPCFPCASVDIQCESGSFFDANSCGLGTDSGEAGSLQERSNGCQPCSILSRFASINANQCGGCFEGYFLNFSEASDVLPCTSCRDVTCLEEEYFSESTCGEQDGDLGNGCEPCQNIYRSSHDSNSCGECLAGFYSSSEPPTTTECKNCSTVVCRVGSTQLEQYCWGEVPVPSYIDIDGCVSCSSFNRQSIEQNQSCGVCFDNYFGQLLFDPSIETAALNCSSCATRRAEIELQLYQDPDLCGPGPDDGVRSCSSVGRESRQSDQEDLCGSCLPNFYGSEAPSLAECRSCDLVECDLENESQNYSLCGQAPNEDGCGDCSPCNSNEYRINGPCRPGFLSKTCGGCESLNRKDGLDGQLCGDCMEGFAARLEISDLFDGKLKACEPCSASCLTCTEPNDKNQCTSCDLSTHFPLSPEGAPVGQCLSRTGEDPLVNRCEKRLRAWSGCTASCASDGEETSSYEKVEFLTQCFMSVCTPCNIADRNEPIRVCSSDDAGNPLACVDSTRYSALVSVITLKDPGLFGYTLPVSGDEIERFTYDFIAELSEYFEISPRRFGSMTLDALKLVTVTLKVLDESAVPSDMRQAESSKTLDYVENTLDTFYLKSSLNSSSIPEHLRLLRLINVSTKASFQRVDPLPEVPSASRLLLWLFIGFGVPVIIFCLYSINQSHKMRKQEAQKILSPLKQQDLERHGQSRVQTDSKVSRNGTTGSRDAVELSPQELRYYDGNRYQLASPQSCAPSRISNPYAVSPLNKRNPYENEASVGTNLHLGIYSASRSCSFVGRSPEERASSNPYERPSSAFSMQSSPFDPRMIQSPTSNPYETPQSHKFSENPYETDGLAPNPYEDNHYETDNPYESGRRDNPYESGRRDNPYESGPRDNPYETRNPYESGRPPNPNPYEHAEM